MQLFLAIMQTYFSNFTKRNLQFLKKFCLAFKTEMQTGTLND